MEKLAIYWEYYQRYHCARANAAVQCARSSGDEVVPISLARTGGDGHEVEFGGYPDLDIRYLVESRDRGVIAELRLLFKMIALLRRESVDALTVMGWNSLLSLGLIVWGFLTGKGMVLVLEGQEADLARSRWKEWVKSRIVLRLVGAVFCGGRRHADYASKLNFPAQRIFTKYDVVDNQFWSQKSEEIRRQSKEHEAVIGLPAERYFLAIGRFIAKKNFEGLVREYAAYVARAGERPWPLVIVGDGPEMERLRALVTASQLGALVHFPGYLKSDAIAPYLSLCGVFLMPSSHYEQWGLVVNEAMACSRPVVVSKVCGCVDDLVVEGETGFQFDPSEAGTLAPLLTRLASGEINLADMGAKAKSHIAHYSEILFGEQLMAAAKTALGQSEEFTPKRG